MNFLNYKRSSRVAELLREKISHIITQKLNDPLIGLVTVTQVRITDDLRYARVYVRMMGGSKAKENGLKGLERAKNFIRNELGRLIDLKYIPELNFQYDTSIDYAQNIESLITQIHEEDDDVSGK